MTNFYLRKDLKNALAPKNSFIDILALKGKTYRKVKNRHTFSIKIKNKTYFIKIHTGVTWHEIFKNFIRGKIPILGAKNEYLAIKECNLSKIPTMTLAGYGKQGFFNPTQQNSFLITDALTQVETLEDLCPRYFSNKKCTEKEQELKQKLIKEIATTTRKLHKKEITHHDLYICHFLLDVSQDIFANDNVKIYLIDLHRAQKHVFFKRRYIIKDLAAIYFSSMDLYISNNDKKLFMETYRQKPILWIQKNEKKLWQDVEKKAIKLYKKIHKKNPTLGSEVSS